MGWWQNVLQNDGSSCQCRNATSTAMTITASTETTMGQCFFFGAGSPAVVSALTFFSSDISNSSSSWHGRMHTCPNIQLRDDSNRTGERQARQNLKRGGKRPILANRYK